MSGSLTEDLKAWEEGGKEAWAASTPGGAKIMALIESLEAKRPNCEWNVATPAFIHAPGEGMYFPGEEAQAWEGVEEDKEEEGGQKEEEEEALGEMGPPLGWDGLVAAW